MPLTLVAPMFKGVTCKVLESVNSNSSNNGNSRRSKWHRRAHPSSTFCEVFEESRWKLDGAGVGMAFTLMHLVERTRFSIPSCMM